MSSPGNYTRLTRDKHLPYSLSHRPEKHLSQRVLECQFSDWENSEYSIPHCRFLGENTEIPLKVTHVLVHRGHAGSRSSPCCWSVKFRLISASCQRRTDCSSIGTPREVLGTRYDTCTLVPRAAALLRNTANAHAPTQLPASVSNGRVEVRESVYKGGERVR
eukprot:COSAG02_NODE_6270_length_3692_cov_13.749513_4_plen_162_part_00